MVVKRIISYVLVALGVFLWITLLFPDQMSELSAMTDNANLLYDAALWGLLGGVVFSFWVWLFSFGCKSAKYARWSLVGIVASLRLILGYDVNTDFDVIVYNSMLLFAPLLFFSTAGQLECSSLTED